jgi:hypothetical protein
MGTWTLAKTALGEVGDPPQMLIFNLCEEGLGRRNDIPYCTSSSLSHSPLFTTRASRSLGFLKEHPLVCSLAYGAGIELVMSLVVFAALCASRQRPLPTP